MHVSTLISSVPASCMSVLCICCVCTQLLHTRRELESEVEALQTIPDHYYTLLQQTYRMEKMHWEEKKRNTEKELNTARTEVGMEGEAGEGAG